MVVVVVVVRVVAVPAVGMVGVAVWVAAVVVATAVVEGEAMVATSTLGRVVVAIPGPTRARTRPRTHARTRTHAHARTHALFANLRVVVVKGTCEHHHFPNDTK